MSEEIFDHESFVTGWMDNDYFVTYHIGIALEIGLNESIMLSKLITFYKHYKKKGDLTKKGAFFATVDKMYEQTALKEKAQRNALNKLEKLELLHTKKEGLPAKRYVYLHFENITSLMMDPNKYRPNGGTDNGAVSEAENQQEPHNSQSGPNGGTRTDDRAEQEQPKRRHIIKELNKEKLIKEKEEEEEAYAHIPLLLENNLTTDQAITVSIGIVNKKLSGFDSNDVRKAIEAAYKDFTNSKIDNWVSVIAHKIQLELERKKAPKYSKKANAKNAGRTEPVPEWLNKSVEQRQDDTTAAEEKNNSLPEDDAELEERKRVLEERMKNLRN